MIAARAAPAVGESAIPLTTPPSATTAWIRESITSSAVAATNVAVFPVTAASKWLVPTCVAAVIVYGFRPWNAAISRPSAIFFENPSAKFCRTGILASSDIVMNSFETLV